MNGEVRQIKFVPQSAEQLDIIKDCTAHLLACGQGGSGKTYAGAMKSILIGKHYKKSCIALIRKKQTDLKYTLWRELIENLPPEDIEKKNDSDLYIRLRNGSEYFGIGLDSTGEVNKLASREYNFAVIEEATEITEQDYDEKIRRTVRLRNQPFHQRLLLCNPRAPTHWIYRRFYENEDIDFNVIETKTIPAPFLPEQYYRDLAKLVGVFAERYVKGKWVGAEGVVYPFNPKKHIIDAFEIPIIWRTTLGVDFGFEHPFVCLWFAISPDEFWYCYRQIYMTHRIVEEHAEQINKYFKIDSVRPVAICDHDANASATLRKYGISTRPANKDRLDGQQSVYKLIDNDKMFFFKDSLVEVDYNLKMKKRPTRIEEEFGLYTWNKNKEDMIKQFDDGMDAMRYPVHTLTYIKGDKPKATKRFAMKVLTRPRASIVNQGLR